MDFRVVKDEVIAGEAVRGADDSASSDGVTLIILELYGNSTEPAPEVVKVLLEVIRVEDGDDFFVRMADDQRLTSVVEEESGIVPSVVFVRPELQLVDLVFHSVLESSSEY